MTLTCAAAPLDIRGRITAQAARFTEYPNFLQKPTSPLALIDWHADRNPGHVLWLHTTVGCDGSTVDTRPITALTLKSLILAMQHHLRQQLESRPHSMVTHRKCVALLSGPNHILYEITRLALVSMNVSVLCLSPRNSIELHRQLMSGAETSTLIHDATYEAVSAQISQAKVSMLLLPTLDQLFSMIVHMSSIDPTKSLAPKTLSIQDPAFIFQTSGSTSGNPKLVTLDHRYLWALATFCIGSLCRAGELLYTPMPLFHIFGTVRSQHIFDLSMS